jgi:hypothetical protein
MKISIVFAFVSRDTDDRKKPDDITITANLLADFEI